MTPDQIAALLSLIGLLRELGPWGCVAAGVGWFIWQLRTGQILWKREYDRTLAQIDEEHKDALFWQNKFLSVASMADRAIEVASTRQGA